MNINTINLAEFFYWINERHEIWRKRFILKQNPPWTKDEVLKNHKFTNVYRDLDVGTLYYNNILLPKLTSEEVLLNTVFYRFFNSTETCKSINKITAYFEENEKLEEILRIQKSIFYKLKKNNKKIFTGAHMLPPLKSLKIKNSEIIYQYEKDNKANRFLKAFTSYYLKYEEHLDRLIKSKTAEESYNSILGSCGGIGRFIAYEIWTDLSYNKIIEYDLNSFVNVGNGAFRGLCNLFPDYRKTRRYQSQESYLIKWIFENQDSYLLDKKMALSKRYRTQLMRIL